MRPPSFVFKTLYSLKREFYFFFREIFGDGNLNVEIDFGITESECVINIALMDVNFLAFRKSSLHFYIAQSIDKLKINKRIGFMLQVIRYHFRIYFIASVKHIAKK
ncbi:hypothetical protein C1N62_12545 [Nissabacter sp. SGAir0207]|nr:hypothetical protein C1N62_12545 [Nissabacter sp. SGAir0207]